MSHWGHTELLRAQWKQHHHFVSSQTWNVHSNIGRDFHTGVDDQIIPKELCEHRVRMEWENIITQYFSKQYSYFLHYNSWRLCNNCMHVHLMMRSQFSRLNLLSSRIVMIWAFISSASTGYSPAAGRYTSLSNSIVFWMPHIITTSKVMSNAWNNPQGCCSSFILLICQLLFQSGSGSYGKLTPQALFLLLGVMESWGSSTGAVSGPQCNAKGVKTRNGAEKWNNA